MLSGTVVALALIPEAIAFSIIAGVDPKVGLCASVLIAVVTAFAGGRPAQISAATGAMALVMVDLVRVHGLDHLFAASVLAGVVQIACGRLKLGRYIRFVPHTVMLGFVNALAILIFLAQLPQFVGATWEMYALVAAGLAIIYAVPRVTKAVPSPLVAIVVLSTVAIVGGLPVRTVGDMGELPSSLPVFRLPQVPLTLDTLLLLLPYAVTLAAVGLLKSLLTATIVDDPTDTPSDKNRECTGQGLANIVAGLFGGMAGCATIGQSVINVRSGGRTRLSTLCAGVFLLFFMLVLGGWVSRIPMAALVAVERDLDAAGELRVYRVSGQLFFASVSDFLGAFDFAEPVRRVELDLTHAHVWDGSAVGAIDQVVLRFRRRGVPVHLLGLNAASATLLDQLAVHHKAATAPPAHHPA